MRALHPYALAIQALCKQQLAAAPKLWLSAEETRAALLAGEEDLLQGCGGDEAGSSGDDDGREISSRQE
jgi:hypothetical protein